jgi:hypothetical protein
MEPTESTPEIADIGYHDQLIPERKIGSEQFNDTGTPLGVDLSDFWGWTTSDLIDNITRGRLAEFIVAIAVGIPTSGVRDSWAAWDLTLERATNSYRGEVGGLSPELVSKALL